MRILMTSDYFPYYGANVLLEIGRRWGKDGHEVFVICSKFTQNGDPNSIDEIEGIKCIRIKGFQFFAFGSPFFVAMNPMEIGEIVKDLNPDIINCHFHTSNISTVAVVLKRLRFIQAPIVFTFHGFEGRYGNLVGFLSMAYWRILENSFSRLEGLTNINREHEKLPLAFSSKVRYISNAASFDSPDRIFPAINPELGLEDDDIVVLFVGQLRSSKDVPTLLEAIPRVLENSKKAKFIIVGSGPLESELRDFVLELGLQDSVKMTGYLSNEHLSAIRKRADIFVLPSQIEGVPLAMLDAMAAGIPVIATNVGSVGDYVENGVNGYLVVPGDPAILADRLAELAADDDKRKRMGIEARNRVAHLTWDNVSVSYIEEFRRIVGDVQRNRRRMQK